MEVREREIHLKLYTAYMMARESSTDRSTKLGAIIVKESWNVCGGVNAFIPGYGHLPEHHERPFKYWVTEHAERNAILTAVREGWDIRGGTMVAPWVACPDCARAIALAGIKHVICHKEMMDKTPERWREMVDAGLSILEHSGVEVIQWSGKVGSGDSMENLMNGEIWYP